LAYDIVKAHGGEIILHSETSNPLGEAGTKFIINLPLT
jgi:signal transduction histidine kinase